MAASSTPASSTPAGGGSGGQSSGNLADDDLWTRRGGLAPGGLGLFAEALPFATQTVGIAAGPAFAVNAASVFALSPTSMAAVQMVSSAAASVSGGLAATAAVGASTLSWIMNLSDSVLRSDMTSAAADGTFSYAEAFKVTQDLYNENFAPGAGKVTAGQFSDLKSIVANLGNGLAASSYVKSITNAFVNGDAFNAYWTGGDTKSIALGNLGVGTNETQLNELIGKWFRGSDRPNSVVVEDGRTFSVSYGTSSAALFSGAGPSINDVNQGYMGDCYLMASLAEVAKNDPDLIRSMIADNGNGTYGVRFYVGGKESWITVDNSIAYENGRLLGNDRNSGLSNSWVSMIEKAYAELNGRGAYVGAGSYSYGNSFSSIANGGWDADVLGVITNTAVRSYGAATSLLSTIISALDAHNDVTIDSRAWSYDSAGRINLVANHAMSVTGYNASTGNLVIRNPWGSASGQTWNTTFEVSLATLQSHGDTVNIDNLSLLFAGPKLVNQTAAQNWLAGKAVNFTVPANTFSDPQGLAMSYSARLADGSALPSWLKFDSKTGTFTGTPPAGTPNFMIKVTATDTAGKSASDTFDVIVPKPPVLASQTASQTFVAGKAGSFALAATTFSDPQGGTLTYSATMADGRPLPSWLSFGYTPPKTTYGAWGSTFFDPGDAGHFSGTPPANADNVSIRVTATDSFGLSVSEVFTLAVARPPVLANQTSAQTFISGKAGSFALADNTFTDPLAARLTYTATQANGSALPSWLSFNAATRTFSGTPPANASNLSLKVTATDTYGLATTETFALNVARPPVLANQTATQTLLTGRAGSFSLAANTFSDPQNAKLTFTATQANGQPLPSWLSFNSATGTFTGTPPASATNLSVKVTATDSYGLAVAETFAVNVAKPPVLANQTTTQTLLTGRAGSFTLAATTFTDPQGGPLTYTATQANGQPLPSWLSFNAATRTFTGTPPTNATNVSVNVTAVDSYGLATTETFALNVAKPPVLANQTTTQTLLTGRAGSFTLAAATFTDPQGGPLTYTATQANGQPLPSWLSFNAATRTFTGTPPTNATNVSVNVTAVDSYGLTTTETFAVNVAKPPVLANQTTTQTLLTGRAGNFTLAANTFTDPQGGKLTYTATQSNGQPLPSWLSFNGATGAFTGTPPSNATNVSVNVTAIDSYGLTTTETFAVNVAKPPVLANPTTTQTFLTGKAGNFTLAANTFTDPQGGKLTYTATQSNGQPLPSWLAFNPATGTFTGTPPVTAANVTVNVTATDSYGLATTESFALNVAKPPVLANQTGTQTFVAGRAGTFALAANTFTDPQGAKLTYSATQADGSALPSWLAFNAATGAFTGTPPANAANLSLKVTATDSYGLATTETFGLAVAKPPVLANQTAAQSFTAGKAVSFTLAANTFTDPQGSKLTYSATLSDGTALPSWLKFDGPTEAFSGTTAANAGNFSIKVTATDGFGLTNSETFGVSIAQSPSPSPGKFSLGSGDFVYLPQNGNNYWRKAEASGWTYNYTDANLQGLGRGSSWQSWLFTEGVTVKADRTLDPQGQVIAITGFDSATRSLLLEGGGKQSLEALRLAGRAAIFSDYLLGPQAQPDVASGGSSPFAQTGAASPVSASFDLKFSDTSGLAPAPSVGGSSGTGANSSTIALVPQKQS